MKMLRFIAAAALALLAFTAQAAEFRQISQILNSSGKPVVNGYIYIGTYGLDPVSNPISLFSDSALSVPIANPVRTDSYGRPTTDIYFSASQYSYQLKDSSGTSIEGPKNRDAIPTQASVAASQAATATSCGTFGGTVDALTCTLSPAITAYTDLMTVRGRLAGDNTGAVTLSVNGVGAKNVVKWDGTALVAGDLQQNDTATLAFDTTNNRWQLQSPNAAVTIAGASTISGDKTFSGANTHSGTLTLTGALLGANPIILEGATANDFETTVAAADPTADHTVTVPNATGTVALLPSGASVAGTAVELLAHSAVAATVGAVTTEATLATITIPANAMGANGRVRIKMNWVCTNSANSKTFRVRFSGGAGTAVFSQAVTTLAVYWAEAVMANKGATNSQGTFALIAGGGASDAVAEVTSAIDTTAATTLVITGQKASAGETLTLASYSVELLR